MFWISFEKEMYFSLKFLIFWKFGETLHRICQERIVESNAKNKVLIG